MNEQQLIELLRGAEHLLAFDAENCDFGPAYGLHESALKRWRKDARKIIEQYDKVRKD